MTGESRRSPLRRKLLRMMLLASGVAALIVGATVVIYEETTFRPRMVESLQRRAQALSTVLLAPLQFTDADTAARYLSTQSSYSDVAAAALYTANGKRLATYVRDRGEQIDLPVSSSRYRHEFVGGRLHMWYPVTDMDMTVGVLFLSAEVAPLFRRLPQYAMMAGAVIFALAAVSALLLRGMTTQLLRPLGKLTGVTERVTRERDYSLRVAHSGTDEIARLSRMLNDMLATIQERDQALRQSESRLRSIIDNEPECVKVIGIDGDLIEMNPAGLKLLEAESLQEACSRPLLEYVSSGQRDAFRQMFERVVRGASDGMEFELVGLRGGRHWLETRAVPMRDGAGAITAVLAISRDISTRRLYEHARERRALQQSVITRLGLDAFAALSLEDLCNQVAVASAEALRADLIGIFAVQPATRSACLMAGVGWARDELGRLAAPLDGDSPCARAIREQSPRIADVTRDVEAPMSEVRASYGVHSAAFVAVRGIAEPWGCIAAYSRSNGAFAQDDTIVLQELSNVLGQGIQRIAAETSRRAVETQLQQSQKMEALGRLAGGIAHDFNNLLSAILGNVRLAMEDVGADHHASVSLNEIQRAGLRSKELVQRILAFSRFQEPKKEYARLQPIVTEAAQLLRATIPAEIEIDVDIDDAAPPTMIDVGQVHQCVLNLGTNAWHALPGRSGRIGISLSRAAVRKDDEVEGLQQGDFVRVDVRDNGSGMDPATTERIFEPFFTTKPLGEGTGLGLSMVHGIMRAHGGTVLVRSTLHRGSVFSLYFPVVVGNIEATAPALPALELSPVPARILYVDDEEALVFLATRLLERLGYQVSGFSDARQALAAFTDDPAGFDLVITDLSMPGMSGMEFARAVLSANADTMVVLASGYLRQADIDAAKAVGIREVVYKPNTVDELGPIVQRLLKLRHDTPA